MKTNTTANIIKEKKAMLEVMEQIFETLDREESYAKQKTVWFDTDEPRKDKDGNIKTRDDGSIVYIQDYKMVDIPDDELSEDSKCRINAIINIKSNLEKLI